MLNLFRSVFKAQLLFLYLTLSEQLEMEPYLNKWQVIKKVIKNNRLSGLDSNSIDYMREQNTVVKLSATICLTACVLLPVGVWQVSHYSP